MAKDTAQEGGQEGGNGEEQDGETEVAEGK
jgi:hypothetical protein